jgi:nitrite reductase/ring-hydroxylating ferredoxin subunit
VGWWPVAHAEELGRHPRSFRLGIRNLALYRDLQGIVRAVDDSCPHRRLPLSMGRITEDGQLQCAYHGWCFDGQTGRCTRIPNLRADEKVPAGIRVASFSTAENIADALGWNLRTPRLAPAVGPPTGEEPDEGTTMFDARVSAGLVLVWTGDDTSAPAPQPQPGDEVPGRRVRGSQIVRAPHARVAEALLWNPGALLGLDPLIPSGGDLHDPDITVSAELITVKRERRLFDLPRPSTYDPAVRRSAAITIAMVSNTGLTWIEGPRASFVVGLTPLAPYVTAVRWRGSVGSGVGITSALTARQLVRRLAGPGRAEALADRTDDALDLGIDRLRAARSPGPPANIRERTDEHSHA